MVAPVMLQCPVCQKKFRKNEDHHRVNRKKFCSHACHNKSMKSEWRKENRKYYLRAARMLNRMGIKSVKGLDKDFMQAAIEYQKGKEILNEKGTGSKRGSFEIYAASFV